MAERYKPLNRKVPHYHHDNQFTTYQDRFNSFVEIQDNGCWEWKGFRRYGQPAFKMGYANNPVTIECPKRMSYATFVDNIQKGKIIANNCGNSNCVNPNHLEQRDNPK